MESWLWLWAGRSEPSKAGSMVVAYRSLPGSVRASREKLPNRPLRPGQGGAEALAWGSHSQGGENRE